MRTESVKTFRLLAWIHKLALAVFVFAEFVLRNAHDILTTLILRASGTTPTAKKSE